MDCSTILLALKPSHNKLRHDIQYKLEYFDKNIKNNILFVFDFIRPPVRVI